MDWTIFEEAFKLIPRILFELLVAEAQAAICLVDFEDNNIKLCAQLGKLRRVLNFLRPREVRDVYETINAFF